MFLHPVVFKSKCTEYDQRERDKDRKKASFWIPQSLPGENFDFSIFKAKQESRKVLTSFISNVVGTMKLTVYSNLCLLYTSDAADERTV